MIVYPIQPTLTKEGALASLIRFLDENKARPIELEPGDKPFTSFRISSEQISISVAAKLDVSVVFKGSFNYRDIGLIFDAIAYTDKYLTNGGDNPVIMTRWGAGMRVAMKVTEMKGNLAASFGSVAASAELNLARASDEILGLGLGLEALTEILDDLPPLGDFGLEAYSKLTQGVYGSLKKYITDHQTDLTPVPIAVGLHEEIDTDPIVQAKSVYLAAYWRDRNKSEEWLIDRHPDIDKNLVGRVYELSDQDLDRWLDH